MYTPERKISNERRKQDLKEVIDIVMHSPLSDKQALTLLDGTLPMNKVSKLNLDVQTGITICMVKQALEGDIKSADWLGKYGGLEPVREQKITMDLPSFYSNMDELPEDVKAALAAESAIAIAAADEEAREVEAELMESEEEHD